jgi:hypothetical protein
MTDLHKPYRLSRELHRLACEIEDALLLATNPANDSPTTAAHLRTARRAAKALDSHLFLTVEALPKPALLIVDGPMASQHPTARDFPEPPNAA